MGGVLLYSMMCMFAQRLDTQVPSGGTGKGSSVKERKWERRRALVKDGVRSMQARRCGAIEASRTCMTGLKNAITRRENNRL